MKYGLGEFEQLRLPPELYSVPEPTAPAGSDPTDVSDYLPALQPRPREVAPTLDHEIARASRRRMHDAYGGRVFSTPWGLTRSYYESPELQRILQSVGMVFEQDAGGKLSKVLLPDPARLKACVKANNLPVALEARNVGSGYIPHDVYNSIVESGKHPVGITTLPYYIHDIGYDHMPAVVVGGKKLFEIINGRTSSQYTLAVLYDVTASNISRAMQGLFSDDTAEFNQLIDEVIPDHLHGHGDDGWRINNRARAGYQLRHMISGGLDRLGVAHPDITSNLAGGPEDTAAAASKSTEMARKLAASLFKPEVA